MFKNEGVKNNCFYVNTKIFESQKYFISLLFPEYLTFMMVCLTNIFPKNCMHFYRLKFNHYFVKTLFTFWHGTQISFDSLEPLFGMKILQ